MCMSSSSTPPRATAFGESPTACRSRRTASDSRRAGQAARHADDARNGRWASDSWGARGSRVQRLEPQTARPDVTRFRANQPALAKLLEAMCGPAQDAADGENGGEQVVRETEAVQQECRVELHIGIEPAVGFVFRQ